MPDFFAHCLVGLVAACSLSGGWTTYVMAIALSTLPDLDAFTPMHRACLHSLLVLTPISTLSWLVLRWAKRPTSEALMMPLLPHIHVLMDSVTGGIPVKLLYPLSDQGFQASPILDSVVRILISASPYSYYLEAVRVDLVLLMTSLILIAIPRLSRYAR